MMRQGRSFSGRERNCCFLNTQGQPIAEGRFANVSAISGLDFPDDGRAMAILDWDLDGDLDVWFSNRNAPRLRLMRNESVRQNHFIAFQLIGNGKTVNRDAIGARIEVFLTNDPKQQGSHRLVKSLRAGEAFLTQSSKWVHFGLGNSKSIEKIVVHWPDGQRESFDSVEADRRYRISQSNGIEEWQAPARTIALSPGKPQVVRGPSESRIALISPLPMPQISYRDFGGERKKLPIGKRPFLLNLWASWCKPCWAELQELSGRYEDIQNAGLNVFALSVDGLGDDRSNPNDAVAAISAMNLPFANGLATEELIKRVQFFHDQVVHSREAIPVPTSILFDADGRLTTIYKGPLSIDDLLLDAKHSQMSLADRKKNAAMIDGRVLEHELFNDVVSRANGLTLMEIAQSMEHSGRIDDAIRYYREAVAVQPNLAKAHNNLGHILNSEKRFDEAVAHFSRALQIEPSFPAAHNNWGIALQNQARHDEAILQYQKAIDVDPDFVEAHHNLGVVLHAQKRSNEAIVHFEKFIKSRPDSAEAYVLLGRALMASQQVVEAVSQFERALEIQPDSYDVRTEFGKALLSLRRFDEAIHQFEAALSVAHNAAIAHNNLGNALKVAGRLSEAEVQYMAALRAEPEFAEAHNNLGVTLQAQRKPVEAISHYKQATRLRPQFAEAHSNWGLALQSVGRVKEAAEKYADALKIQPNSAKTHVRLGMIELSRQQVAAAANHFQDAIRLTPNSSAAHAGLGQAMLMSSRPQEAVEHLSTSLRFDPDDIPTMNSLAWLLATCQNADLRDGQRAIELAEIAARKTNHERASLLDTLAAAYAETGDFAKAVRWQKRAIELAPENQRNALRQRLESYQADKPHRE